MNRILVSCFTAAIFLSAFLLFAVQPLFAKMVLPQLGGAPAVWSVAMVFFQAMLLLGYLYAHLIMRFLPMQMAALVHIIVTAAAFLCLPIALASGFGRPPVEGQIVWLLSLFTVSIGLPFFALAANGPLLQAWFSRTGHPQAQDPYFLYSGSNVGSLLALLLYPVLFEPNFTLGRQSVLWTEGYALFFACLVLVGIFMQRSNDKAAMAEASVPLIQGWAQRALWTAFAFIPSALLIAVTAYISTDVASVPFLWIAPLVLYLLTFIIAFMRRPLISERVIAAILPFAIAPLLMVLISNYHLSWLPLLCLHLLTFFLLAMLCHGRLAKSRPPAQRLTEFYFFLSLGGVLGGLFSSIVAPGIFNDIVEYPFLIIAALLALPGLKDAYLIHGKRDVIFALGALGLAAGTGLILREFVGYGMMWLFVFVIIGTVLIADRRRPFRFLVLSAGALLILPFLQVGLTNLVSKRSFFGVHKVYDTRNGVFRVLQHGTTIHGAQYKDPARANEPVSYYTKGESYSQAIETARASGPLEKVGIVGLGGGTLACLMQEHERMTFFEIDPVVVSLAQREFSFLRNCAPDARIVLGDARLTLADEENASYDLLILDAFTSDAVPVHLLTQEALRLYLTKLKPEGFIIFHISNRNLEMESMLATSAAELKLAAYAHYKSVNNEDVANMIMPAHLVVMARGIDHLAPLSQMEEWRELNATSTAAWRDDFSNIFGAMMRHLNRPRPPTTRQE